MRLSLHSSSSLTYLQQEYKSFTQTPNQIVLKEDKSDDVQSLIEYN